MKKPTGTSKRTGPSPVAEKRSFSDPAAAKKPARRKAEPKKRGNVVTRGVTGFVSLIWRVIWGTTWRLALVMALIIGAASF